ncbi:MAG TPA: hypothetical protein VGB43_01710 [Flavobacterium sp.]
MQSITPEEAEAVQIIKSILGDSVHPDRLQYKKGKTYLPILLDGDSWKPICRLYFNGNKYIGTITVRKVETKRAISGPEDIHRFSDEMVAILKKYVG